MRVMTWNLWWRYGPAWQEREKAILETLRAQAPDVVMLQEVWRAPDGANQAEILARTLGYDWVFAPAETHRDGIELGNAVLSRWPVRGEEVRQLPKPEGGDSRVALLVQVEAPGGVIPVVATHLTWHRTAGALRQKQVAALMEFVDEAAAAGGYPPIVGGDFNADPDSDEIRAMVGRGAGHPRLAFQDAWEQGGDLSPGFTWTPASQHFAQTRIDGIGAMPWLRRRIDYLFVGLPDSRPAPTTAVQVERAWLSGLQTPEHAEGSDHYAVVADLAPHRL